MEETPSDSLFNSEIISKTKSISFFEAFYNTKSGLIKRNFLFANTFGYYNGEK